MLTATRSSSSGRKLSTASPGEGRRAARPRGHAPLAARKVDGLEGALVDADVLPLGALDPADPRTLDVRVAGPAALLVAKVHKIADRTGTDRLSDKDALDAFRLLRGTSTAELAERYNRLLRDDRSASAARRGRELLVEQFARSTGVGVRMTIRSVGNLVDPDEIAASCEALVEDLLSALEG